jgi:hypothetical protein
MAPERRTYVQRFVDCLGTLGSVQVAKSTSPKTTAVTTRSADADPLPA